MELSPHVDTEGQLMARAELFCVLKPNAFALVILTEMARLVGIIFFLAASWCHDVSLSVCHSVLMSGIWEHLRFCISECMSLALHC